MRIVPEQEAWEAFKNAIKPILDADLTEAPEGVSEAPSAPRVTLANYTEVVEVRVDDKPVIGIDLEAGTIGHWPDGETWVLLIPLPEEPDNPA